MNIDTSSTETLFASVKEVVSEKWSVFELPDMNLELPGIGTVEIPGIPSDGNRWLHGRFGDVQMDLGTFINGSIPIVKVTCVLARFVPKSEALVAELNSRNKRHPLVGLGIRDETERHETVRVSVSTSVFGNFINPVSVQQAVEMCVWPANILLAEGFLARHGGELRLVGMYRQLASSFELTSDIARAEKYGAKARELEQRSREGDIGRYPDLDIG